MSDVSSISSSSSTPTAMTGAGGGDKIRILGTNTGLDVDAIVKKMLKVDQTRVDDEDKKLQKLQWKQEAYQDIIASVKDLQNSYFNLSNLSSMVTRGDNYSVYKATSSDDNAINATALSNAIEGNYSLTVYNMAKKATISGMDLSAVKSDITTTTKLSDLGLSTSDKLTIKVDGNTSYDVTFTANDESIASYLKKINEQTKGTVSGYFDEVSHKIILQRSDTGASKNIQIQQTNMSDKFGLTKLADGTSVSEKGTYGLTGAALTGVSASTQLKDINIATGSTLTINVDGISRQFTVSSDTETINEFLTNDVNTSTANGDKKIMASFDSSTNSIKIMRTESDGFQSTNASNSVQIVYNGTNDVSSKLNLNNVTTSGINADISVTSPLGETRELTYENNKVTLDGVIFNLEKESTTSSPSTTITVKPDVDTTFNLIKGFIDKYNALVDKVQTKLTEQPDKDSVGRFQTYEPLTDAQKASMTTDQINKWEAKAKVGIIANDDTLTSMMSRLREAFYDKINDVTLSFGKKGIGLDTVDEYKKGGRIEFTDGGEDTLKDAIANNRNQVMELFTKESDSTDKSEKYNNEGIFQRVNDIFEEYVGKTGTYLNSGTLTNLANEQDDHSTTGTGKGDTIPDQIYRENMYIKDLQDKMSDDSEKYYNEFSKLEVAMQNLNSQSSWLSQMMGQ